MYTCQHTTTYTCQHTTRYTCRHSNCPLANTLPCTPVNTQPLTLANTVPCIPANAEQWCTCQQPTMYTCQHKAAVHLPKKGNQDSFSVLTSLHVLTFSDHFFQLIFLLVCFWHLSVMLRLTKVKKQKQLPIM